ncbi:VWA domain-containing protein [Breznakiella homolactica]|uniref:VWA domain-containing protein n=1 Tax=Breznakiella homolactica TaxID=2798577 RepID=A0A7T7XMC8_9SPIR|nr:VWA domain-containing protein [Breznakiella homolactica]QQO09015.1 VWA domain-containing protein [Breznakiella homolactica]
MRKTRRIPVFGFLFLFMFSMSAVLNAQEEKSKLSIKIDQIISDDFPNIRAYAVIQDDKGEVLTGLSPGLFQFRIDSMETELKSQITPFAMKEAPIDYSIIFSNNGIMEGEPLDFQKNALLQFIDTMKASDRLSLYTIGEEAGIIFEEMGKEDIDPAMVNSVEISSVQPRVYDSVINVVRKVQRRHTDRRVIIIISDGRDQNSRFTKDQMNTVLGEADIPIYAIGIRVLNTQSLSNLNEMADFTGGSYIYSTRLADIPDNLKRINSRITQPYIIDLKIRKMKADELPHVLEVSVNTSDSSGKGQKTFVAVKVPVPRWVRWTILIAAAAAIAAAVVVTIILRIKKRHRMGITKRKCPECRNRMKDTWDSCPFCRYLPEKKKKKKHKGKSDA